MGRKDGTSFPNSWRNVCDFWFPVSCVQSLSLCFCPSVCLSLIPCFGEARPDSMSSPGRPQSKEPTEGPG